MHASYLLQLLVDQAEREHTRQQRVGILIVQHVTPAAHAHAARQPLPLCGAPNSVNYGCGRR
jgi:hypothetical protein